MESKHTDCTENHSFFHCFGISNKILFIVLLTIFLFTIGLSVSVGVTSFQKFTDVTMNELNRMSAVFARSIEALEEKLCGIVGSVYGNKHFLEPMQQLSNKGPSYALERELMGQHMEESERIYFFQAQLNLINILQPLLGLNNLDNIVLYLTSPFDMVRITEAVPVLIINENYIFVNQFKQKGEVNNTKWFSIKIESYTPPSPDYFDVSSVYALSLDTFVNDMGFNEAEQDEIFLSRVRPQLSGPIGTGVRMRKNTPVFKAWHSIVSDMANPETFEEEPVVTGFIVVEQELSHAVINKFADELGLDLGIALHGKLLMPGSDKGDGGALLQGNNRLSIDGVNYYFSINKIALSGFTDLEAVAFSPVSVLNEHTRSLSIQIAFTGIALMLITGTLIFFVVQKQIRDPLKKLMAGVSLIAEGEFESKVNIDTKDELGKLALAFNDMSSSLSGKTKALYKTVSELEKAQSYISSIINSMPSILIGVDANGRVTQWNNKVEETIGINADRAKGRFLVDIFPQMASEMEKITESIRTRETKQEQKVVRQSEEGICYEDVTIYPLITNGVQGVVIRIDDVTEKVRMEEIMIQGEKMLSLGGLAAGIAHEINNPLAGMMQTADVVKNRLTNMEMSANRRAAEKAGTTMEAIGSFMDARGILKMVTTINESGRRVAKIVTNMLSFARKSEALVSPWNIGELIDNTLDLAVTDYNLKKQYAFKQIEVRKEYEAGLPAVPCEGIKIQQVLLNIFRNGAQAMQAAGVETPRFIVRTRFEKEQNMAAIEIGDNGPGMDEATRKRIFEPFFTTKPAGVGTGLGLSVSYFIITENHGGKMTVESAPGSGTNFIIRLPLRGQS
jgi:PAS domain S-box-containing protein